MLLNQVTFDLSRIGSFGITVSIIGYLIVFSALVVLFFVYNSVPKLLKIKIRRKLERQGKSGNDTKLDYIPGEVNAAIAMALHMYFNELHDEESMKVTIKKVSKRYSPWSSKIYGTYINQRWNR